VSVNTGSGESAGSASGSSSISVGLLIVSRHGIPYLRRMSVK
jgi:hypothetical protein